jgi:hypothetical protein
VWWYTSAIPGLSRLRQEDCEFEASLDYIKTLYLQKKRMIILSLWKSHKPVDLPSESLPLCGSAKFRCKFDSK